MALLRSAGALAGLTRSTLGRSSAVKTGPVFAQRALYAAEAAPEAVSDVDGSVTQVRWLGGDTGWGARRTPRSPRLDLPVAVFGLVECGGVWSSQGLGLPVAQGQPLPARSRHGFPGVGGHPGGLVSQARPNGWP